MRQARTKIVCTVGPACADPGVLEGMLEAGADVFRVNGAHVGPRHLAGWVRRVRRAARKAGSTAAVMVDLPGIKMRTGAFQGGTPIELTAGERVRLFAGRRGGTRRRIPVHPAPDLAQVRPGREILLDDGRLRLRALRLQGPELIAAVEDGGPLAAGKGVAFPGTHLDLPVPTRRDRSLARAAVAAGADWLALSFVREAADVKRLKDLLRRAGVGLLPVAAKIERAEALDALDSILTQADAAIVARGDLGVDAGPERVPALQKQILDAGRRRGRPVIVATEMLESMTQRRRPTRAEASDVAGAVYDGADALLLSGETAVGAHPVLVVETMDRIVRAAEADAHSPYAGSGGLPPPASRPDRPDQHVVRAAVLLAEETGARAIVVFSRTGASAVRLSKERPRAAVYAFAPRAAVCRRLSLAWGVRPRRLPGGRGTDAVVSQVLERLRREEGLAGGERAVLVMGGAQDPAGATTLVKLLTL